MGYCTSASGAARWRNVRGDRDSGIDSEELSPESADTESQVVPLPDRLVSAVAPGRLELIPLKGSADLSLHSSSAAFPPCGDGRYINI